MSCPLSFHHVGLVQKGSGIYMYTNIYNPSVWKTTKIVCVHCPSQVEVGEVHHMMELEIHHHQSTNNSVVHVINLDMIKEHVQTRSSDTIPSVLNILDPTPSFFFKLTTQPPPSLALFDITLPLYTLTLSHSLSLHLRHSSNLQLCSFVSHHIAIHVHSCCLKIL